MTKSKGITSVGKGQSDSAHRRCLQERMAQARFVAGTQQAYLRAFDRFEAWLDRKTGAAATVGDARRYLSGLKEQGVPAAAYSHASAALKFFFESVRGLEWRPVSPLRERMIEDMMLRQFSPRTCSSYVRSVLGLACHYKRSPDTITEEEIRRYFVHLTCERKLARPTITIALCGIKFFYETTLGRDWSLTGVPVPKRQNKLPVVLTVDEVRRILGRVHVVRHRACLTLIYACGLRLTEGCSLTVRDIDRARGLLHVNGKGSKDRYVPLPPAVLPLLEACWLSHRNPAWLFPRVGRGAAQGGTSREHVPIKTVQQAFREALKESGVAKQVSVHSLRHAYATHLLEKNVRLQQIQQWLGHSSPKTTTIYAHVTEPITQEATRTVHHLMDGLA